MAKPSLSFGYFGHYAEAAVQSDGREIVRRWTGGGIVPHGDDLTYSVVIPASHSFFARPSLEIYALLHDSIRGALAANGVSAILANSAAPKVSENCFANAVTADVMSGGRKIAGAAHRRSRAGLFHQGSIQRCDLPDQFRIDFAQALCDRPGEERLTPDSMKLALKIAAKKYGTLEWLTRR